MSTADGTLWEESTQGDDPDRLLPIGAVKDLLAEDFPSISISKIRYLEDQRLISPRRTAGGYRLYGPQDLERLRTILRLQRDEFLPLRVIRQELDAGASSAGFSAVNQARQLKRAQLSGPAPSRRHTAEEVVAATGVGREQLRELEEFGLVGGGGNGFDENDLDVAKTAVELAHYGVEPRHLRSFLIAADREAGLLEQILAAGLRSRNPERRREALAELESLAALASHLRHLLLVAALRRIAQ